MAEVTRRSFLTHASIGVAGGALVSSALPRLGNPGWVAGTAAPVATEAGQALIAHVRNVSTGEIAIMVGTREVIHRDRSLAVRLMDIADKSRVR